MPPLNFAPESLAVFPFWAKHSVYLFYLNLTSFFTSIRFLFNCRYSRKTIHVPPTFPYRLYPQFQAAFWKTASAHCSKDLVSLWTAWPAGDFQHFFSLVFQHFQVCSRCTRRGIPASFTFGQRREAGSSASKFCSSLLVRESRTCWHCPAATETVRLQSPPNDTSLALEIPLTIASSKCLVLCRNE